MIAILKKLLFQTKKKGLLLIAFSGSLMGMVFLLISTEMLTGINGWIKKDDGIFSENTLVIQKRISNLNTLNLASSTFSQEEIEEINALDFIDEVALFNNNQFDVSIKLSNQGDMPYFRTDMFLQSLPAKFLDINQEDWQWKENAEFVPIIMPEDYLTLYNHGFAIGQGLPQISKEAFSSAVFDLEVQGNGQKKIYKAKIVHLTSKVNSILVPEDFLNQNNMIYGEGEIKSPSRLIITTNEDNFVKLENFINENNFDVNQSIIDYAKIKSYLNVLLSILIVIGLIILVLSVSVFVLYSVVIITKNEYEIKTLLRLGYAVKFLSLQYVKYFSKIFGIITLCALLIMVLSKFFTVPYLKSYGIEIALMPHLQTIFLSIVLFVLFIILNRMNIIKSIKTLGK